MKRSMNRLLSMLLAFLMILQIVPVTALSEADEESATTEFVEALSEEITDELVDSYETGDTESVSSDDSDLSADDIPEDEPDIIQDESENISEAEESDVQIGEAEVSNESEEPFFSDDSEWQEVPSDDTTDIPYEEDEDGNSNYPPGTVVILEDPALFEPWPADAPLDQTVAVMYDGSWIKYAIYNFDHTYVLTAGQTKVYDDTALSDDHLIYTIADEGTVLLATEYYQRWNTIGVTVWFITPEGNITFGYVLESDLVNAYYTDEEAAEWAKEDESSSCWIDFGEEILLAFVAEGWYPEATEEPVAELPVEQSAVDTPLIEPEQPLQDATVDIPDVPSETSDEPSTESGENSDNQDVAEHVISQDEIIESDDPATTTDVSEVSDDNPGETDSQPEDDPLQSNDPSENPSADETDATATEPEPIPEIEDLPLPDESTVCVGDYVLVTTDTRVYLTADNTVTDDYGGDAFQGYFVTDAVVQVEDILLDDSDREWYCVQYLYGDTMADGSLKWTESGSVYVLPDEATKTDESDLTVTDYALRSLPRRRMMLKAKSTTAMNGFTLKNINVQLPTLHAGQTGVYGSSGKDSEYKQIASVAGKGAVYATPHYLDGWTVYCLEHTLDGPGEGSGSNQSPKGPYAIVDIDTYMNTPGNSRVIYKTSTMHAIAWVLRHTYPFMALDRSDSDNLTWSRVAGQFAIRQVIREMEGAQYVRDYWNMDNFYVASGQAPSVYLEYARWLATNGIARGKITGKITVSNKSVAMVGSNYVGTVTLSTDADLIRIPRSAGTITGNSAGKDSSYYYLNSGDTIQITSSTNGFSVTAESVNSDAEEASFLVGVPDANIQKVLIPMEGYPYKMQSTTLSFEVVIQYGDLTVTKKRDRGDERVLSGAIFQLYNSSNQKVGSPVTTGSNGIAKWTHLEYGTYYLVETSAPAGYILNSNKVTVSINAASVTYTAKNTPVVGSVKFIKKANGKDIPLVGAKYELVTKNGSSYSAAVSAVDGKALPALVTDSNGSATWSNVVEQGEYYVHEVQAPEGYQLDGTYYKVNVTQNNTIVTANVTDPIITAKIKIVKKDALLDTPLTGAEFTITRLSAPTSHNGAGVGDVVAVITTDTNGNAETGWLDWGKYKVEETKVPLHFVDNHFSTIIEAYENGKTYTVTVDNEPTKGWIRLVKTDRLDGHAISGVVFDIYQGSKLVTSMTTDANGVAISAPLPKGKYTVKERNDPQGYTTELVSIDCEVKSDETTELTATNMPIQFRIKILKTDQLTKEPLAGAEFTIIRKSGLPSHNGEGDGTVVATLVTDENGETTSELLTWGVYEVKESKVPVHFVDNHFTQTVTGSENDKTYVIQCENEPTKGYIKLVKTDKLDRTPIEGVQFDIYYNDQYGTGLATTMTTNADGVAVSPALRKGTYIVKEHTDPTGYVTELLTFDSVVVKSDEATNISGTNMPIQGKIRIVKKDQLTKEALAGAEFTVTRISGLSSHKGSNDGEVVAVIVTDADGIAVTPLLTWGTYKVEETKVPVHFVDNHYSTEITINEENLKTYEIEVENEPTKGWIRLTKTDRKNGNPIAGVQFDIYYNDQYGEGLATTMVTDENGIAMSEPIRKGRYIVKEHGATAGYVFEEVTLECTVKSDEITDLAATNQPVQVRLNLYKRDKDEYSGNVEDTPGTRGDGVLTGAVFQVLAKEPITDRQGNVLYENGAVVIESLKTAGDSASVLTAELWPGVYEFVELTPPTGYQPTDAHVTVDASAAALQSVEPVITYTGIMKNEILYGKYAFVKFTGDNEIHDDAGLIETPEPGAVFQLYLKSAGSYDAARKFERDKITTDRNGKAETKLLPYGIYTVQQTNGKAGYAIKAPFDIFITGKEDPDDPPSLIVNNEAVRYRLRFIKVDAETGNVITLPNTAFKLKDSSGAYVTQTVHYPSKREIDTFYTDEDGTVMLPETVRRGLYFIEEVTAPEGYLIQTEELAVFVGDENMNEPGEAYLLEFQIENTPVKGKIILEKTGLQLSGFKEKEDRFGNTIMQPVYREKQLADAIFEIHAAEDIVGKDGTLWYEQDTLVDTITTTAEGHDASTELPLGKYYLIEISAPEGYTFEDTRYEANLVYADDHTPLVETTVIAGNDYIPAEISLLKEKEIIQTAKDGDLVMQSVISVPGEGFVFGLYNDTDIHYDGGTLLADHLLAVGTTDANGELTFAGNYPHGRYTIRELYAPDGWRINPAGFSITLDPVTADTDHVIRVSLPEPVLNELIWYPVTLTKTDITGEKTLPGALIEVSNAQDEVIYRAYTDQNGQIPDIPVVPGKYTFREILAPSGYALNEAIMTFTVDADGGITGDTTIRDDYTRLLLLKQDESRKPLMGVEFSLVKDNGTVIMRSTSDSEGRVIFEKIPYGTYQITETKALAGYLKHDVSIDLTVDGSFVNQDAPLETIVNHPIILKLKKTDQDGKPLAGAEYALIDEYGDTMGTVISDEDGILTYAKIPYGKYSVKELSAPDGYLLSKTVTEIVIGDDYQNSDIPAATLINHLKRLRYIKVDTTGKYLPGVEFSLINASNGEIVEVVASNEHGEFIFTKFDYGFWKIRETKVPEGYSAMEDIIFNVDADWTEPEPVTCVNIPNHYEFVKTDNEGNPMAGVKFTLEDSAGNILRDLVSGEDGIVHVTDLTPGTYIIREIETLEGYAVSGETIEVVIDEHYVVPEEMFTLVNYPNIQTGVDFVITPVMWMGGLAVLAGILFLISYILRRRGR